MALSGCGSGEFDGGQARGAIEASPVKLDAEQVMLTQPQVDCGVQNDLWEPPSQLNPGRSVARLTAKGRALKFDDDVAATDPDYRLPHVQVRGEFALRVLGDPSIKDGPEKDTRLVEAKVGVRIDHSCFPAPLPMMGLKKGNFTPDATPVFLLRNDGGWRVDSLVH
jgi:hypothetical protein